MATVGEIYDYIDTFAPFSQQQSYDNSGICVGGRDMPVKKVLTALDITKAVADEAERGGFQLVISHHPVIFHPLKCLTAEQPAVALANSGIAAVCAHTSFDSAQGGMNDLLAQKLGLKPLQTLVYEEGKPIGYVCTAAFETSAAHLASQCKKRLGCKVVRYTETPASIAKIGICSGSGGGLWRAAAAAGCQAMVTGDVKHSDFVEAADNGFCLIDAGHFYTENIFHAALAEKLAEEFPELVIERSKVFTDPVSVI